MKDDFCFFPHCGSSGTYYSRATAWFNPIALRKAKLHTVLALLSTIGLRGNEGKNSGNKYF